MARPYHTNNLFQTTLKGFYVIFQFSIFHEFATLSFPVKIKTTIKARGKGAC
jgi:hypothetical protein